MLRVENLDKHFKIGASKLQILKNISFEVKEGESLAVRGPSGAGKSTLLHILGGLDRPDCGKVYLDEEDIYSFNDSRISLIRNEKVGFVFQFYYLIPELNILENVALPLLIKGQSRKTAFRKSESMLEFLKIEPRKYHYPNQVSGGEQQRAAIARALIVEPRVLLCDEPTGNLDSQMGQEVLKLLTKVNIDRKTTVVVVTHDEDVASWAKDQLFIKDGYIK
ncbi:MAG: ABC transporter ATP-binding protein [Candidatus Omnitrophica bacterium]|nr:ABC transporter ATP-binding protein [Candidatus Omnitrophota bacterium]